MLFNMSNDCFTSVCINLLNKNVIILSKRVSSIDEKHKDCNIMLKDCVKHHQLILEYFGALQDVISPIMLAMFFQTIGTVVTNLVMMIFLTDPFSQRIYLGVLIVMYIIEITFQCYYGSEFQRVIGEFPNSIYCSEWYNQSHEFKQNLMIFVESALRPKTFSAAGLFPISLRTLPSNQKAS